MNISINQDFLKKAKFLASRTGLVLEKESPKLLLAGGILGFIGAAVLASKATYKLDEVLAKADVEINSIHLGRESVGEEQYSDEDYKKDLAIAYGRKAISVASLYAPSVALGTLGVGCVLMSHHIMNKRQVATIAAYNLLQTTFKDYRERVSEKLGPDEENDIRHDITNETVKETIIGEDGKKSKIEKTISTIGQKYSQYAKFFDEYSMYWQKDRVHNQYFVVTIQNSANDMLVSRGHLFLNEVYDMLGIPRTPEGAVVGWVYDSGNGDKFVDFGIYNAESRPAREFVNGYNDSILLDFNVDGVIYDLI